MLETLSTQAKILLGLGIVAVSSAGTIGAVKVIDNLNKVEIVSVQPAIIKAQQPYQDCHDEQTTEYVKNHKSGTEGAVIGGVGGAAVVGAISHSWVGAGVGAVAGAVGGDLIERSRQPDYVAKHGEQTKCKTAYKDINVPVGYQITYIDSKGAITPLIIKEHLQVGTKIKLEALQTNQVTPEQQKIIVNQAIGITDANKS